METAFEKSTRRSLLDHFSAIQDTREPCKVMYPLPEVLLLVVCATIAGCDDYDEIADWGKARLQFLRQFQPHYWGIPCEDWLRVVMNRVDPDLFAACFTAWANEQRPEAGVALVAIDGKTSRRSHDRSKGKKALHLVSAWASHERLVLGQEAVDEKSNETTAIPALLDRLAIEGALVTIDAIACNPRIARTIVEAGADYLLAVKENQPSLHAEMQSYFDDAPADEVESPHSPRQGPWPHRDPPPCRVQHRGLDVRPPPLSGRAPLRRPRHHWHGRIDGREGRRDIDRATPVYLLGGARCGEVRRGCAIPLDHRKPAPLDPGRAVQRGSVPAARRPWRSEHGRRPTLRPQSTASSPRPTKPQDPKKACGMGHRLPTGRPRPRTLLTWTRCPAQRPEH